MKIPISKRLLCCAGFVEPGARVADIGTDHGYLGIYLLKNGIARQVTACDLRPLPLRNAQENAERFGVGAQMEFLLSDGLERVTPDRIDTPTYSAWKTRSARRSRAFAARSIRGRNALPITKRRCARSKK